MTTTVDDTSDDMIWTPYVAADGWAGVSDYPPYRSYGRTTFVWFCRLCRVRQQDDSNWQIALSDGSLYVVDCQRDSLQAIRAEDGHTDQVR
jgi:hypothetical protein